MKLDEMLFGCGSAPHSTGSILLSPFRFQSDRIFEKFHKQFYTFLFSVYKREIKTKNHIVHSTNFNVIQWITKTFFLFEYFAASKSLYFIFFTF